MPESLLLDEHYSEDIARCLREFNHAVLAVVAMPNLRGASDDRVLDYAVVNELRVVTENIKDFRPMVWARATDLPGAKVLLVHPRRFPRGTGSRNAAIISALDQWLNDTANRSQEEWLV